MSSGKIRDMNGRTNPKGLPAGALCVQHVEERDKRLITGLDEQDSERVILESNPFEGLDDWRKDGSSGD